MKKRWLKVLGQATVNEQSLLGWKQQRLWIATLVVALAVPGELFPATIASWIGVDAVWVELTSTLTFIIALIFSARSSRCPSCRLNLLFYAMGHEHAGNWFVWLLNVKTCPRCGCSHSVETRHGKQG